MILVWHVSGIYSKTGMRDDCSLQIRFMCLRSLQILGRKGNRKDGQRSQLKRTRTSTLSGGTSSTELVPAAVARAVI